MHIYEVRPRKDHRGVDLISDALLFGRLCYARSNAVSNAMGYAKIYNRSHDAVIRVYDEAGLPVIRHVYNHRSGRRRDNCRCNNLLYVRR